MPDPESPANIVAETKDAGTEPSRSKKDMLNTPPIEAREMDLLLKKGLQAHNTVGFLTFVGLILLGLGFVYFRFDKLLADQPYRQTLTLMVDNQVDKDMRAYRYGDDVESPKWPMQLYKKLYADIFFVAALALLLAAVFLYIEKAKLRRSDVLVYRALAREIEKLRLRVKKMEGNKGKPDADAPEKSEA